MRSPYIARRPPVPQYQAMRFTCVIMGTMHSVATRLMESTVYREISSFLSLSMSNCPKGAQQHQTHATRLPIIRRYRLLEGSFIHQRTVRKMAKYSSGMYHASFRGEREQQREKRRNMSGKKMRRRAKLVHRKRSEKRRSRYCFLVCTWGHGGVIVVLYHKINYTNLPWYVSAAARELPLQKNVRSLSLQHKIYYIKKERQDYTGSVFVTHKCVGVDYPGAGPPKRAGFCVTNKRLPSQAQG